MVRVTDKELVRKAREAKENAYCDYSNFHVGAALLTRDGEVFVGVNVENINFSGTIHAEENSLSSAVASGYGVDDFEAIAVTCKTGDFPCGKCRQMLSEFQEKNDIRIIADDGENYECTTLSKIFPSSMEEI